jgi:hypothetical protein
MDWLGPWFPWKLGQWVSCFMDWLGPWFLRKLGSEVSTKIGKMKAG